MSKTKYCLGIAVLILALFCNAAMAADPNHWAYEALKNAEEKGAIVSAPNADITRGEVAFSFLRSLFGNQALETLVPGPESISFPDLKGHKYEKEINFLASWGYFRGYPDGTFRPDAAISRTESVVVLVKVFAPSTTTLGTPISVFEDISPDHWAFEAISKAVAYGIVKGYEVDGKFYFMPNKKLTVA